MQFSTEAAPTKPQAGDRDAEIPGYTDSFRWKGSSRRSSGPGTTGIRKYVAMAASGVRVQKKSPRHQSTLPEQGPSPSALASHLPLRHSSGTPQDREAATWEKPPGSSPNSGTHCEDRGWAAPKGLSLLSPAYLPKLPLGQVCSWDQRDGKIG